MRCANGGVRGPARRGRLRALATSETEVFVRRTTRRADARESLVAVRSKADGGALAPAARRSPLSARNTTFAYERRDAQRRIAVVHDPATGSIAVELDGSTVLTIDRKRALEVLDGGAKVLAALGLAAIAAELLDRIVRASSR
jgi:hypothetical protein